MKTERIVVSLGIVLCTCFSSKLACEPALTIRHFVWGATVLLLFVSVLLRIKKIDVGVTRLLIFKVFVGMVAVTYLSSFKSINVSESLYGCLKITVGLLYFVILSLIIDRDTICKTFVLLSVGLGILGVYQLTVWIQIPGHGTAGEVFGTMCNKNIWAELFVLMLPFCFCMKKGVWRILGITGILLILVNLYFLFTRSTILALCIYAVLACLFYRQYRVKIILLSLIAGVLVYTLKPDLVECAMWSLNQRLDIWQQTLIMSWDNIWLGVGVDNWRIVIPKYLGILDIPNLGVSVFMQRPHNGFILALSETGVFGLIFYTSFIGLTFYYAVKSENKLVVITLGGYVAIVFFSFQRERAIGTMIPIILSALVVSGCSCRVRKISHRASLMLGMSITPVLILSIICFWGRYKSSCFVNKIATVTYTNEQLVQMDYDFTFGTLDLHSCPLWFYSAMAKQRAGDYRCSMIDLKKAYKNNPNHMYVLNNLGGMSIVENNKEGAVRYFKEALVITPDFKVIQDNLKNVKGE
jgi:O-antigen ligase